MGVSRDTTIGAVMSLLRQEIESRKTALAMLEALVGRAASPTGPVTPASVAATDASNRIDHSGATAGSSSNATAETGSAGAGCIAGGPSSGKKPSIAIASVRILREAGRPMHGVHELVPALAARGFRIKYGSGLGTLLLRTGEIERTAPGTYAAIHPKGGGDVGATSSST